MRHIDADRLKQVIDLNFAPPYYDVMRQIIDVQPTIEAESVVHGEWVENIGIDSSRQEFECSECGFAVTIFADGGDMKDNGYNYCPNCGAKIKGEKGNDM